ncbi:unnamed protein product [Didymodactylos carnosus]|uniref:deoxyribose-phosphate aldolase n=1 Tax=Didymodactylos carnosus TaxID=1234261 RepID=A0A8S2ERR0_9BILA|nr:unnamed protein product [Didymodactylos carnosus]CAF4045247.1 unnamed protein product [Didymodactylos carnosus]
MSSLTHSQLELSSMIDHTLLKQDSTDEQIITLCSQAVQYQFASVCIQPTYVELAHKHLKQQQQQISKVKVCTVIGFPLGSNTTQTKLFECQQAIEQGAEEIDMVINIGKVKSKQWDYVEQEIKQLKDKCKNLVLKVIIETCLLTREEKIQLCQIVTRCKADYIKTSTGFSTGGATLEDIKLMRENCGENVKIKASGGIRDIKFAKELIKEGATRLGTSSGTKLVDDLLNDQETTTTKTTTDQGNY